MSIHRAKPTWNLKEPDVSNTLKKNENDRQCVICKERLSLTMCEEMTAIKSCLYIFFNNLIAYDYRNKQFCSCWIFFIYCIAEKIAQNYHNENKYVVIF